MSLMRFPGLRTDRFRRDSATLPDFSVDRTRLRLNSENGLAHSAQRRILLISLVQRTGGLIFRVFLFIVGRYVIFMIVINFVPLGFVLGWQFW